MRNEIVQTHDEYTTFRKVTRTQDTECCEGGRTWENVGEVKEKAEKNGLVPPEGQFDFCRCIIQQKDVNPRVCFAFPPCSFYRVTAPRDYLLSAAFLGGRIFI